MLGSNCRPNSNSNRSPNPSSLACQPSRAKKRNPTPPSPGGQSPPHPEIAPVSAVTSRLPRAPTSHFTEAQSIITVSTRIAPRFPHDRGCASALPTQTLTDDGLLSVTPVPPPAMAAATTTMPPNAGVGAAATDKQTTAAEHSLPPQVHTPPTTDEASHKESDDAASSSSLSELGDDVLDEENRMRFEDAARAGAEAEQHTEIKPHHYENNIPIFQPVCHSTGIMSRYEVHTKHGILANIMCRLWKSSKTLRSMSRASTLTACNPASSLSTPRKNGMF